MRPFHVFWMVFWTYVNVAKSINYAEGFSMYLYVGISLINGTAQ